MTKAFNSQEEKRKALVHVNAGRFGQAEKIIKKLCRRVPDDSDAWFLLGAITGQLGRIGEAIKFMDKSLKLCPDRPEAHYNLGRAYLANTQYGKAIDSLNSAIKLRPDYCEAYINLGICRQKLQQYDQAALDFTRAVQINPLFAEGYYNRADTYRLMARLEDACVDYKHAISIEPKHYKAYTNLGLTLQSQGKLDEAIMQFQRALMLNHDEPVIFSNLLFLKNCLYRDHEESIRDHSDWARRYATKNLNYINRAHDRDPSRVLRIGYVSPDFSKHSVAYFLEPLLANHNPYRFKTYCYSNVENEDEYTRRFQKFAHCWRGITGLTDEQAVSQIKSDRIDILVDLAGHTAGNRLLIFTYKPAPIQVSYLGYPNTSGLPSIDYRLTDAIADPPGQEDKFYTETLIRMPGCFLCYQPPDNSPRVTQTPALETGHITFGSFNALHKCTTEVIAHWVTLLQEVPGSRLVFKNKSFYDDTTRKRFQEMFTLQGISADRVDLVHWDDNIQAHLARYSDIDIALDTFPYNGTTTTFESLWMGVPVMTLTQGTHASRVSASILSQLGLGEFITDDKKEYVKQIRGWAGKLDDLNMLRMQLRARLQGSTLMAGESFARKIETYYREIWENWCLSGAEVTDISEKS